MSPVKTKPTVWLCPEANDASCASGWLKGVSPKRRQASKLKRVTHLGGPFFVYGLMVFLSHGVPHQRLGCAKVNA